MVAKVPSEVLRIARDLLNRPTAPFREHAVRDHVRAFCSERGFHVEEDPMGNLLVSSGPARERPLLAFAAHMDHPGFIVERDSRGGRTVARFYGAVGKDYFPDAPIRVFTARGEVTGRMTSCGAGRRPGSYKVGLSVDGPVRRGDLAMWDLPGMVVRGDRLYSRACDDLVGCAAILALFESLSRRRRPPAVLGVFTVAEEAHLHGAAYLCRSRRIPLGVPLIAIEASRALPSARIGDGVVIRVGDRESVFTPGVTAFMLDVARDIARRDAAFRFQRKLMDGGVCESSLYQAFGHVNGAVCVPLGNYHNRDFRRGRIAVESVSVSDLANMVALFREMVRRAAEVPRFLKPRAPTFREERLDLGERFLWSS